MDWKVHVVAATFATPPVPHLALPMPAALASKLKGAQKKAKSPGRILPSTQRISGEEMDVRALRSASQRKKREGVQTKTIAKTPFQNHSLTEHT